MNSAYWISLIAIGEFALLMVLLVAIATVTLMRRRRRENDAAHGLAARVKEGEVERRHSLQAQLAKAYGIDEGDAEKLAAQLVGLERQFFQELIRAWLTRDSGALGQMDEQLRGVVQPYLGMQPTAAPAAADSSAASSEDVERVKALLKNNADELTLYRETLNRLFAEYTAMFGAQLDPKQQLTAKEIMERLKSGQLGDAPQEQSPEPAGSAP
jgi:uncharacterized protein YdbL (DUF1318 family)